MKIEQTTRVEYDEVNTDFCMKLPALFQRLQRAALKHSESVGLNTEKMVAGGGVWILSRMRVVIHRLPHYGEKVTVRTWHKGSVGFRAGRDFLLSCADETVAAATSLWFYFDVDRSRIVKIPKAISTPYTAEAEEVLDAAAIDFKVDKAVEPQHTMSLTTREGDYDPNGHVNNTVYLEYLETLLKRSGFTTGHAGQIGIQYLKEIGRDIRTVQAGLSVIDGTVKFLFFDRSLVYAAGFVRFD